MQKFNLKQYSSFLILGILFIVLFKVFDPSWFSTILNAFYPIIIGAVLAYFLDPIVKIIARLLNKSQNSFLIKHQRVISVLIVFIGLILLLILLLNWLIPTMMGYVVELISNIDTYVLNFENTIRSTFEDEKVVNFIIMAADKFGDSIKVLSTNDYVEMIAFAGKTGSTLLTILMGLIFCPYILVETKKLLNIFDRLMLCFISERKLALIHEYAYKSHQIFGSFVYGKFIDSLIIGIIALIGFGLMDLPFFPLLAFVIFITNIIPYFGPFIGGIPVTFVVFLIDGLMTGIATGLFIFVLQQFDGLLLGPYILGDTVGISPFWIITSITVFGSLFGFFGMFLGVPMICVIRMFFDDFVAYRKKKKAT
ncbi:AI-2E family transporter [Erysipelatoclostridium sp. An173]|uniref:AI-2E family transporter n=1 Tax=Erysipelatoclostridium sp. An173 TaxID=1965571 RepID=UPI0032083D81